MMALHHRTANGGRGQVVDVALYESVFNMMESFIPEFDVLGYKRERAGNALPGITPSNTYATRDGKYVIIGANNDSIFKRLMSAIGRDDLADVGVLRQDRAVERRTDEGVLELDLGGPHARFTRGDRGEHAVVPRLRAVELGLGDQLAVDKLAGALERLGSVVAFGARDIEVRPSLGERGFHVGALEASDDLTLADPVSFLEAEVDEPAGRLRGDGGLALRDDVAARLQPGCGIAPGPIGDNLHDGRFGQHRRGRRLGR